MGYRVMQIGCDPKADSTYMLHGKEKVLTVLDLVRTRKNDFSLEDMVTVGYRGIICVEAGGPTPGWAAPAAASSPRWKSWRKGRL